MGVTDKFTKANVYLHEQLGYALDPDHCDDFRSLLARCGWRRFVHAVDIVLLTPELDNGIKRHNHLLDLMRELLPAHRGRYRNPNYAKAKQTMAKLDSQLETSILLDK